MWSESRTTRKSNNIEIANEMSIVTFTGINKTARESEFGIFYLISYSMGSTQLNVPKYNCDEHAFSMYLTM